VSLETDYDFDLKKYTKHIPRTQTVKHLLHTVCQGRGKKFAKYAEEMMTQQY